MFVTWLIVALSALLFYSIVSLPLSGLVKFILVAAEMYIVGSVLAKRHHIPTEMGFLLIKSKKGLEFIDRLARNASFWNFFADTGTVICYGLLSVILFRKQFGWKPLAAGLAALTLISFIVAPLAIHFLSSILMGSFEKKPALSLVNQEITTAVLMFIMYSGGFFFTLLLGILYYGFHIGSLLVQFLFFGQQAITTAQPGGTLLLPGINLPLLEGILALAVVLVVHETSHAVLSRIASVPLLSSGIVLFGIIPIGAFVEPDEKELAKKPSVKQTRILAAGSTANFLASLLFALPFLAVSLLLSKFPFGTGGNGSNFLYVLLGLIFSLNFVVAAVNLLPLPLFDGYRILELNIQNKKALAALMYITLAAFILNFIPWFFAG